LKLLLKELELNGLVPGNVGRKGLDAAVNPCTVSVMGPYVAPVGSVTVKLDGLAPPTAARTAPKYTMLFAAVGLKLFPVIETALP
jgi:hypothetical protein